MVEKLTEFLNSQTEVPLFTSQVIVRRPGLVSNACQWLNVSPVCVALLVEVNLFTMRSQNFNLMGDPRYAASVSSGDLGGTVCIV